MVSQNSSMYDFEMTASFHNLTKLLIHFVNIFLLANSFQRYMSFGEFNFSFDNLYCTPAEVATYS